VAYHRAGAEREAAPTAASALSDLSLEEDGNQEVSLAGAFSDADSDALTITASSDAEAVVTVTVASDSSILTLTGVAAGAATVTVTARDADGNTISDSFASVSTRPCNPGRRAR